MIEYVNLALIIVSAILLISLFIVLATGAQKKETLYAPRVPLYMGDGSVRFVTTG
jgi:hypothetical protein